MKRGLLICICLYVGVLFAPLNAYNWHGKWIQAEGVDNYANTWQVFRKEFVLEITPKEIKARIVVDTKYWLWVNDSLIVFEGGLKRGPNPTSSYYDIIDLSPYLCKGKNVIAILTCYYGRYGFSHNSSGYAAMLFDSHTDFIDISSDSSWQAFIHPCYSQLDLQPNFRLSESNIKYTADKKLGDWHSVKYDKDLPQAKIINDVPESIMGELYPRPIPLLYYSRLKEYESTYFDRKSRILSCKLPYCSQITPYIKIKSSLKNRIIDIYSDQDIVSEDQCVRCQYITDEGAQEYENYCWLSGHTIYYHIPEGVEVEEVGYRESGYDCKIEGYFNCSDSFLNELWNRSCRTLYVNMRDTYMDCPDRERAQWWGDVVNEIQEVPYVMSQSAKELTEKAILELIAWQRSDDVIYSPIPANAWFNELPVQSLMAVGIYGFYTHYILDGETEFISKIYNGIHRYLHNVWEIKTDGSLKKREGNWNWGDWGDNVDVELLQNCWYYLALKAERSFAKKLNKDQDAHDIGVIMSIMKKNFIANFWKGNGFRSDNYEGEADDRANSLAVLCDFVEEYMYPDILKILEQNKFASPLMELYVFRALCKMGYTSKALKRVKDRYSLMMFNKEITTVCEHFSVNGGSVNHAWGAWLPVVMVEEVCGVRAKSPGFESFDVKPNLGFLDYVCSGFTTPYGRIEVNISSTSMDLIVPKGTTAHVVYKDSDVNINEGSWHFDYSRTNSLDQNYYGDNKSAYYYKLDGVKTRNITSGIIIENNKKYAIK